MRPDYNEIVEKKGDWAPLTWKPHRGALRVWMYYFFAYSIPQPYAERVQSVEARAFADDKLYPKSLVESSFRRGVSSKPRGKI